MNTTDHQNLIKDLTGESDLSQIEHLPIRMVYAALDAVESKHQEELANYNSYAASEVEDRWQNEIDKVIQNFELQSQLVKTIDPTDKVATMIFESVIKTLKAITID